MLHVQSLMDARIISACAEQTHRGGTEHHHHTDHLRVCGADLQFAEGAEVGRGSSPRVRSRLGEARRAGWRVGIISACAEQTGS